MNHEERPMVHAVDFDGVIVENQFPDIGKINENVVKEIKKRKRDGGVIILWTTRIGEELNEAVKFCREHNIPIDYVNRNVDWLPFKTSRRIFADEYICDRSFNPKKNKIDDKVEFSED